MLMNHDNNEKGGLMISVTPDIIPFVSLIKAEVLTQTELDTVKGKTLQLLSEVGVHFPSSLKTALR